MFSDMNGDLMHYIVGIEEIPVRMLDWTDGGADGELGGEEWAAVPIDFDFREHFPDATAAINTSDPDPTSVFFPVDGAQFIEGDTSPLHEDQWEGGNGETTVVERMIILASFYTPPSLLLCKCFLFSTARSVKPCQTLTFSFSFQLPFIWAFTCSSLDAIELDDPDEGDATDESCSTHEILESTFHPTTTSRIGVGYEQVLSLSTHS